jgi:hypothetical protein
VFSQFFNGQASKALVAVLTTIAAALPVYYGNAKWEPIVIMALGAVITWLVPNIPKPPPPPTGM